MRTQRLLLAITLGFGVLACSSDDDAPPKLQGSWLYVNADAAAGFGVTLRTDGTYTALSLALTSSSSANAEVETGTYVADTTTVTVTPTQWTCPGPDPVEAIHYSFNGKNLVLALPSGVFNLTPNTASADQSFAVIYGCYDNAGTFVRAPLAPVGN